MDMEAVRAEWRENGAVVLKNLLDQEALEHCRKAYDFAVLNPSPLSAERESGGFYEDGSGTKASMPVYYDLIEKKAPALAQACLDLWGDSKNVWYFDHELFRKYGGKGRATPFHQDTMSIPFEGQHMAVIWISFEAVPQSHSLEMVRGSHKGRLFNSPQAFSVVGEKGRSVESREAAKDDVTPLWTQEDFDAVGLKGEVWPTVPDLAKDKDAWDLLVFPTRPGDVVVFHPHSLHGGAPVTPEFPERHTLALRFFGDDCIYRKLPVVSELKMYRDMKVGSHFSRNPKGFYRTGGGFLRVRGPGLQDEDGEDTDTKRTAANAKL